MPVHAKTILSIALSAFIGLTIAHGSPPAVAAAPNEALGRTVVKPGPSARRHVAQARGVQLARNAHASPAHGAPKGALDGNSLPTADAGPDQTAAVGQTAYLDGSRSSDADGDPLTYSWILVSAPHRSQAALSEPSAVSPSIFIDTAGRYRLELVVDDGHGSSVEDTVTISTVNSAPTADAGPDITVGVGIMLELDGGGSSDPDGDRLSFAWAMVEQPEGSGNVLNSAPTAEARQHAGPAPATLTVDGPAG